MSGYVKSFYMKVQSQSEQVCRWKMSWMASLRRIALSVGNSWLTPSWGLSLIRRNLAKLTKLSRGRYDIPSWPKLEDELRWKRLQLHELTWWSCCLDFSDKFAAKWQLNTVKKTAVTRSHSRSPKNVEKIREQTSTFWTQASTQQREVSVLLQEVQGWRLWHR